MRPYEKDEDGRRSRFTLPLRTVAAMSPNRNRLILFLLREIAEIRAMANDAWVRALQHHRRAKQRCGAFPTLFAPTPEDLFHNAPTRLGNVQKVED